LSLSAPLLLITIWSSLWLAKHVKGVKGNYKAKLLAELIPRGPPPMQMLLCQQSTVQHRVLLQD
jgi:hypothetical protein